MITSVGLPPMSDRVSTIIRLKSYPDIVKIFSNLKTPICAILFFTAVPVLSAVETEEQRLKQEVETSQGEMEVSFEEYEEFLDKLLAPRSQMDINLTHVLVTLGCILLVGVSIFFIQQIRSNLVSEARPEATESPTENVATEQAALTQSVKAAESKNFREALRFLYLSAIFNLQERGLLTYDRSLTNLEYLRTLGAHAQLQQALGPAIRVFDDVWYGYKPCDAETVADYREMLKRVYLTSE
ncbi:MAG: DUF4129 domain-containing protein [Candidatus Poribacteria bacterium]|nr:DUF4129 domain-containing protein [Candidatus Poribacteria bacterium]MDE0505285.1 DUF4129 domain-containing protein [Candidatus Poribacteria bacterium]